MLEVHEHGLLIGGGDDPGDLAAQHAVEEALDLRCPLRVGDVGVGGQHLVVGSLRLPPVGLDPHPAVGIDPQAVG